MSLALFSVRRLIRPRGRRVDGDAFNLEAMMDELAKDVDFHSRIANRAAPTVRHVSRAQAEAAVEILLAFIGDDPSREGLAETPARVARAYAEIFAGYAQDPADVLGVTFSEVAGYDEMVVVSDIPFVSHCEHHMAPFFGRAAIAYYPEGGVVGLSKLARLVEIYARRLQTQETMTAQILAALDTHLTGRGPAVLVEAEHMCMSMRGVRKPGATTSTLLFSGRFRKEPSAQARFFTLARAK